MCLGSPPARLVFSFLGNAILYPPLPESNGKELLLWLLRRRRRFQVTGRSMMPLLQAGDQVLVDLLAYRHKLPQVGDIVVAQHPKKAEIRMIKRVALIFEQSCFLVGDNRLESTDSRSFGCVPFELLQGGVTSRLP